MSRVALKTIPSDDRSVVTIEMHVDDVAVGHMFLDAADLDGLIQQLGNHRAALVDGVPSELDPGSRVPTVVDPNWRIPDGGPDGAKLLVLRHPCFGWLGFAMPHHEARSVADWLTRPIKNHPSGRG